jgi:hypothetical protein
MGGRKGLAIVYFFLFGLGLEELDGGGEVSGGGTHYM